MSVFVKGSGSANKLTFKNGVNVAYESSSQSQTASTTAQKSCLCMVIFTRSNRNTSDSITWTVKKNGSTIETFTAPTGRMAQATKEYSLKTGDVLSVTGSAASGYAGARNFFVATGENSIS